MDSYDILIFTIVSPHDLKVLYIELCYRPLALLHLATIKHIFFRQSINTRQLYHISIMIALHFDNHSAKSMTAANAAKRASGAILDSVAWDVVMWRISIILNTICSGIRSYKGKRETKVVALEMKWLRGKGSARMIGTSDNSMRKRWKTKAHRLQILGRGDDCRDNAPAHVPLVSG